MKFPYCLLGISLIMYILAPVGYDYYICLETFIIFLTCAFFGLYKLRKIEFYGFNLLFSFSFFCCCYIFPIFIYSIDSSFSLFHHGYDEKVISKSTCLATVAYASYLCGLMRKVQTIKIGCNTCMHQIGRKLIKPAYLINTSIIIFLLYVVSGGLTHLKNLYNDGSSQGGLIIQYLYVLVSLIPVLLTLSANLKFNKKMIIVASSFIILFLFTGSRTIPLAIILGLFYVYNENHRIPAYVIIILMMIGIMLLAFIGSTRSGQDMSEESNVGAWNFFLDLIVTNRNLYDEYALLQTKGYEPNVLIGPILAVLPMGQSLYCSITGIEPYRMTSAMYLSVDKFGLNPPLGLGTNIVGEVYMSTGLLGTLILFYILGYLISKSLYMIKNRNNIYWYIFYISMLTNGIFICRGSFFYMLRPYIWTLILIPFINLLYKQTIKAQQKTSRLSI